MGNINEAKTFLEQYSQSGGDMGELASLARAMVGSGKTPTGLNQWVLTDKPTMHDFNEDNRIIDAKFREADAQFQESDAKLRELDAKIGGSRVNPNILHNWDFRNPVNQRGQNVYTATNDQHLYTIDRWILSAFGTASLTLNNDAIAFLTNNVGGDVLVQHIEFPHVYSGKTLTASLRGHQSNTGRFRVIISATIDGAGVHAFGNIVMNNETSVTTLKIREGNITSLRILVDAIDNNVPCILEAAKLELGTVSTLANDPPMDFGRELAVCQRYQLGAVAPFNSSFNVLPNFMDFIIHTPTTMRIAPTIARGELMVVSRPTNAAQSGFDFEITSILSNAVRIRAHKVAHGVPDAYLSQIGSLLFDANL